MSEVTEVCRAFRNNGKCRYGDECKYEHSTGEVIPNPPRGPCFNWKESGECKFGDRCRFKHGDDDERFDADGNRKPREKDGDGDTKKKRRQRRQRKPLTEEQINERKQETCNNFLEGKCRYGDKCWRKHPEQKE